MAPETLVTSTAIAVGLSTLISLRCVGRKPLSAAALLAAVHCADIEFYLRMLVVELLAAWRRQRADVGEPDRTRYCCWPTDLDHSASMNHAKYLRFVNYAQRQFWMRNGVWAVCRKRSPPVRLVVAASTLRVTRPVRCFERFAVTTRLLAWDDRAFFLQQTPRCMAAHSRPASGRRGTAA
ncbi:hypothetical protein EMIHUDRAFT_207796 [Emiliania huxleyi CCMP1516]|uniref:Uncharacterized protein n=2 Tax=Emiliania huxleyi TaxID=2903 RepID=A0A0D3JE05_EMIH1|nr:hypothetical protein EMIHUDRAFT_207796 [Emiliania huxleyi CCMP1516]EOD21740.1 hypothetical protein EMIHUDRAFT_207796 [Emiliania huxleyi CCMP1516]|eukprot:XP_005774169.1 hypothetical protein EMIHUDRAFT_207796 [Emiliania huxleyi CCMP1516]